VVLPGFELSETLHCVITQAVPDVSDDHSASIFRVTQSKQSRILHPLTVCMSGRDISPLDVRIKYSCKNAIVTVCLVCIILLNV